MQLSKRSSLVSYAIRDIILEARALEKQGVQMFYLNIGDPAKFGFKPPEHIRQAFSEAVLSGEYSGYAPSQGDPELIEEVKRFESLNGEVFITSGVSEGIDLLLQAILDPGENLLMPSPSYPLYVTKSKVYGRSEAYYPTDEEWLPDPEVVRRAITKRTKALLLINPNNPTGAVYPPKLVKAFGDIAAEEGLPLIVDEIYWALVYEGDYQRAVSCVSEDVPLIIANGLSKSFFYPGARLGWLVLRNLPELAEALTRMTNARLSVNWEVQKAAEVALRHGMGFLPPYLSELRRRRDAFYKAFSEIDGLRVVKPSGAFYAFLEFQAKVSDWEFVKGLLKEGVVTVPGRAFSSVLPPNYFRVVFLPRPESLSEAAQRVERFLRKIS